MNAEERFNNPQEPGLNEEQEEEITPNEQLIRILRERSTEGAKEMIEEMRANYI